MQDNIMLIKQKSLSGMVALISRTFILQIIAFTATFFLTVLLSPQIFGVYFLVSAVISFLNYFSDVGLAAALIQKKDEITDEDLASTFTIQEILIGLMSILMFIVSPLVTSFYKLNSDGLWLFRALTVSFFISSLKTIPSIILERKLEFKKLVIPQILETLIFYLTAVFLAWRGYGISSFTYAVILRAVSGLIAIWVISPWHIHFGLSGPAAKRLLHYGFPFQMNSFLALIKDDLLTIFLGKILTLEQIGYIGWAKKWAEVPLRLIMDNVIRITFPAFSRLQHSKELLSKAIEKTVFGLAITVIPISVVMVFFMKPVIYLIPKYLKWEPALLSFMIFVGASVLASLSTPLTNALNAIGKIRITLWLMLIWTALTWILTIFFIYRFGFNGFSFALFTITWSIVAVVYLVKRFVPFSFFSCIAVPALAGSVQAVIYFLLSVGSMRTWPGIMGAGAAGVILYLTVLYLLEKVRISRLIRDIYEFGRT